MVGQHRVTYEEAISGLYDDCLLARNPEEGSRSTRMLAEVVGQFCGCVALAFSAWGRLSVCGPVFERLLKLGQFPSIEASANRIVTAHIREGRVRLVLIDGADIVMRGLLIHSMNRGRS